MSNLEIILNYILAFPSNINAQRPLEVNDRPEEAKPQEAWLVPFLPLKTHFV